MNEDYKQYQFIGWVPHTSGHLYFRHAKTRLGLTDLYTINFLNKTETHIGSRYIVSSSIHNNNDQKPTEQDYVFTRFIVLAKSEDKGALKGSIWMVYAENEDWLNETQIKITKQLKELQKLQKDDDQKFITKFNDFKKYLKKPSSENLKTNLFLSFNFEINNYGFCFLKNDQYIDKCIDGNEKSKQLELLQKYKVTAFIAYSFLKELFHSHNNHNNTRDRITGIHLNYQNERIKKLCPNNLAESKIESESESDLRLAKSLIDDLQLFILMQKKKTNNNNEKLERKLTYKTLNQLKGISIYAKNLLNVIKLGLFSELIFSKPTLCRLIIPSKKASTNFNESCEDIEKERHIKSLDNFTEDARNNLDHMIDSIEIKYKNSQWQMFRIFLITFMMVSSLAFILVKILPTIATFITDTPTNLNIASSGETFLELGYTDYAMVLIFLLAISLFLYQKWFGDGTLSSVYRQFKVPFSKKIIGYKKFREHPLKHLFSITSLNLSYPNNNRLSKIKSWVRKQNLRLLFNTTGYYFDYDKNKLRNKLRSFRWKFLSLTLRLTSYAAIIFTALNIYLIFKLNTLPSLNAYIYLYEHFNLFFN